MKQLFGNDWKDADAKELSRVTKVEQPKQAEAPPRMRAAIATRASTRKTGLHMSV